MKKAIIFFAGLFVALILEVVLMITYTTVIPNTTVSGKLVGTVMLYTIVIALILFNIVIPLVNTYRNKKTTDI